MTGMLIISLLTATGASEVLPQNADTCLLYTWESGQRPLMISEEGDYALWLYAASREVPSVRINGGTFSVISEERKEEFVWRKAGVVNLKIGPAEMFCDASVKLVAISKASGFRPEKMLTDISAAPFEKLLQDRRAEILRDTDTVFTMPRYETLEAWETKAALLRTRILLGSGLYPMPEKTPLNAKVFDETAYDGFIVSKVHFEPWPGFLATGNLYRPVGEGPFPGVINPHGHWEHGRLEDSDRGSVPARCITLARMGAVAFSYDMIGYVDSKQTAHNWGGDREKLWGIHTFAMQLWTSVRALDFMSELPYVDVERLGCTGASGGGTQTFAVTAIDPRVKVAVPVNMISSTMQGGCLCENAPILRLDNSNMEIGALTAPRPLLMVSATGDWTRESPRVEYPAIRSIYALYGAEDQVANVHLDYGHNYNQASREAMYRFLGAHLLGGDFADFTEQAYVKPPDNVLRVFPEEGPPKGYLSGKEMVESFVAQARERRAARLAGMNTAQQGPDVISTETFSALLGAACPPVNQIQSERFSMEQRDGYVLEKWGVGRAGGDDQIPVLFYRGADAAPQDAVIMVHGKGKAFLADIDNGGPGPLIKALLQQGKAVLTMDAFLTGEHQAAKALSTRANAGKFQDTFLPTDTGRRVQDILTARAFLAARYDLTGAVDLIGLEEGGIWSLLAGTIDGTVKHILVDMNQFDINDDEAWERVYYVPGLRAIGDIPAALIAAGPERFHLFNALENKELRTLNVTMTENALSSASL